MDRPCSHPDDQHRFHPGLATKPFRQMVRALHGKEAELWWLPFIQHDRPTANNGELGFVGGLFQPGDLLVGKDAGEKSAPIQVASSDATIIANVTANLKTARDLLRMITEDTRTEWKVRRTTQHEIELFLIVQQ